MQDALDGLAKDHGLAFNVNERAFKYDNLSDVLRTAIAETPIPPMKATLGTVLKKILSRVGVPSGATYIIRRDQIEARAWIRLLPLSDAGSI